MAFIQKYKYWVIPLISFLVFFLSAKIYLYNIKNEEQWKAIRPSQKKFTITVPATGTIDPENRIVVMAPVAGRIDKFLVKEGDTVRRGQIIAWLSSTDRAALLDMAQTQSADVRARWEKEYLPTPILAPSSGLIIRRNVVVGQTITQQTSIFEISDKLVVRAEVDETDIAKIQVGQEVAIRIDAYPEQSIKGIVLSIAHQSKLSNNVNTYEVLVDLEKSTVMLRSGMTVTVSFLILEKEDAILAPSWIASGYESNQVEVFVKNKFGKPEKRKIEVGVSDGKQIEILSGITMNDEIMYLPIKFLKESKSPFTIFKSGK